MVKQQVETVLGAINPEELGITFTHEHVTINYESCSVPPSKDSDKDKLTEPITLENLNWLRHNPYSCQANLNLAKEKDAVVADLKLLKKAGGCTIVENTSIGINRDVATMIEMSKSTGLHIVCGTGYYVERTLANNIKTASVEELTKTILADINDGIDDTKVKAGIIGEVGCSLPLTDVEKRSLRAAGIAQSETQSPVMIHPGRDPSAPFEDLRIFQEAGGDAKHTVIAHLGRTISSKDTLVELAETGVFLEYDLFGSEVSYFQEMPTIDMLSDAQRINMIGHLISQGYGDRILVAHDIHTCQQLTKYGGHGYAHILDYAVPKMRLKGITQTAIDKILVSNPKTWLTYY